MTYTDAQKRAIGILDRNLQIIACAGSGKTQAIAPRAAFTSPAAFSVNEYILREDNLTQDLIPAVLWAARDTCACGAPRNPKREPQVR